MIKIDHWSQMVNLLDATSGGIDVFKGCAVFAALVGNVQVFEDRRVALFSPGGHDSDLHPKGVGSEASKSHSTTSMCPLWGDILGDMSKQ